MSIIDGSDRAKLSSNLAGLTKRLRKSSPIMDYFTYDHLAPYLQGVSRPFCELATWVDVNVENGPEKSVALRKLLEAKEASVRATVVKVNIKEEDTIV